MKKGVQNRLPWLAAGVSSGLGVLLVLLPVILTDYGIYDALRMALDFAWTGESRLMGVMMGGGRFVYAWLARVGFSGTEGIGDLWILRMISVLSLAGCASFITLYACRQGWQYLTGVCIGLIALVNPGAVVYGFWSACFPYAWAILASFLAGILWEARSWKSRTGGVFLMQIALLIYQPAALYFFLGPFLGWFGRSERAARPYAAIWCSLGLLLNLLAHLVLVKVVLILSPDIPGQSERLVEGGLFTVLSHVILTVIPRIFYGWGDMLPGRFGLGMALILGIGWVLFFLKPGDSRDRWLRILCLLPIGLTLAPAFISAGSYAPYRLLAPAYCGFGAIALVGFSGGFGERSALSYLSVTGLSVVLLIAGSYIVQFGIVKPRTMELSVVHQTLRELVDEKPLQGMVIIRPHGTAPTDQHVLQKAEYGSYELSYGGFSEAYLSLVAADLFQWPRDGTNPLNRIHWVFCPSTTETVPPFYPVLDLRVHLQGLEIPPLALTRGTQVRHPYLGDALYAPPNLYLTPNLGLTQQEADRWFFKPGSGWMQWTSEPGTLPLQARDTEGFVHIFPKP